MPKLLKSIDKIAREKQRGVLFIRFDYTILPNLNYKTWQVRKDLVEWLEQQQIPYQECFDVENIHGNSISTYMGQLYIDVPYDVNNEHYLTLSHYLENDNGQPSIEGVFFYYLPLEVALKNAHHDEPGFDPWADESGFYEEEDDADSHKNAG